MSDLVTIARVCDLPPEGRLEVALQGRRIALFRTPSGVFATAAECPHRGGPLVAGWVDKETVYCPLHGWEFDLRTGKCAGHEGKSVECYEVSIEEDEIRIRLEPR
jgi:nitrite reductase/ring-hydroxylating ferredoxin subunit